MSYVPKYILKRLVPKDAVKKVEGGVEIEIVNVISPIPAEELPGSPLDEINIYLNGEELSKEEKAKIKIYYNDREVAFEELPSLGTIPVGEKLKFFFPSDKFNVGDEVTVKIEIPIVTMEIEFTRKIN